MVYNGKNSTFNELFEKMAVSNHHQNVQKLAVEMFKVDWCLSPQF